MFIMQLPDEDQSSFYNQLMNLFFDGERRVTTQHMLVLGIALFIIVFFGLISTVLFYFGDKIESKLVENDKKKCRKHGLEAEI